jgi:GAF domain-containing protein
MTALTRVSRELSTTLDLGKLMQAIYDEILRTTAADCGTILLLDGETGADPPAIRMQLGCPVNELSPLEQEVLHGGEARLIAPVDGGQPASHEGAGRADRLPGPHRRADPPACRT